MIKHPLYDLCYDEVVAEQAARADKADDDNLVTKPPKYVQWCGRAKRVLDGAAEDPASLAIRQE